MKSTLQKTLGYRSLAYLVLSLVVGAFSDILVYEGASLKGSEIFFLFNLAMAANLAAIFLKLEDIALESTLFAFFLSDAAIAMLLVRSSGSSASPFLVLFPLMTLAGAMIFRNFYTYLLTAGNLVFMILGVGFGL